MKMKIIIVALSIIALAGCVSPPTAPIIKTTSIYNPNDAAYIHEDGNAIIEGQAFLRTTIGEVRTCAGAEVRLIAVTEYSKERIRNLYGNIDGGRNYVSRSDDPDPQYVQDTLNTVCDAEGDFRFTGIPPGEYFVTTGVFWQVPRSAYSSSNEGAALMKRIRITGSEDESIRILLH